jgi:hypothetical protein
VSSADWTAVGTIALAAATLIALATTIVITVQDRRHANEQIQEDRQLVRDREQLAAAYAVQVVLGQKLAGEPMDPIYEEPGESVKCLVAIVVNRSEYTITGIEARFSLDGKNLVSLRSDERVSGYPDLPGRLQSGLSGPRDDTRFGDRLTPWDTGMRLESYLVPEQDLAAPYPIVRWTDRWGTRWEHKRGEVEKVDESAPWLP